MEGNFSVRSPRKLPADVNESHSLVPAQSLNSDLNTGKPRRSLHYNIKIKHLRKTRCVWQICSCVNSKTYIYLSFLHLGSVGRVLQLCGTVYIQFYSAIQLCAGKLREAQCNLFASSTVSLLSSARGEGVGVLCLLCEGEKVKATLRSSNAPLTIILLMWVLRKQTSMRHNTTRLSSIFFPPTPTPFLPDWKTSVCINLSSTQQLRPTLKLSPWNKM